MGGEFDEWMHGCMDRRAGGRVGGWTDGWADGRLGEQTDLIGQDRVDGGSLCALFLFATPFLSHEWSRALSPHWFGLVSAEEPLMAHGCGWNNSVGNDNKSWQPTAFFWMSRFRPRFSYARNRANARDHSCQKSESRRETHHEGKQTSRDRVG